MKKWKTAPVWVAFVGAFALLFHLANPEPLAREDFSLLLHEMEAGGVAEVRIDNNEITVTRWDDSQYVTLGVVTEELSQSLSAAGIRIAWGPPENTLRTILLVGVPLILLLGLFGYFLKKNGAGHMNLMEIRKSRARLLGESMSVRFSDVGGCVEAKEQLQDLVDFLRVPERWASAGVRLPRGVLLEGPPGCGKTLLARAVAGETDAQFYWVPASEFVELFVGVGAARVRDMFETAAKTSPAVIFIDELDAVGRKRGSGIGAGHDEREQTLNQILVCLDGFEVSDRVVVIAATNRSDILDPALLRPGRFDRRLRIDSLSRSQRLDVLRIHCRNKAISEDVTLESIAERCSEWSGAALENLVNEAGLLAVRRSRKETDDGPVELIQIDFERALEPGLSEEQRFDAVDSLLAEATTQLAQAVGKALVRVTLAGFTIIEGELVWADANFIKVRTAGQEEALVLGKGQIQSIEALDGTESVDEFTSDPWSGNTPDLA
ncbi:MAG: AAA family ATPase [Deltaproteobacteria bacterium]|nr:AAA family ATPase [Deltaproteobacteria bacterium]MBW2447319.1 AAA family ATPase [Deltaproteobacteria bacterium]